MKPTSLMLNITRSVAESTSFPLYELKKAIPELVNESFLNESGSDDFFFSVKIVS